MQPNSGVNETWTHSWLQSQAEPAPKGQRDWPEGWTGLCGMDGLWPCSQLLQKGGTEQAQDAPTE